MNGDTEGMDSPAPLVADLMPPVGGRTVVAAPGGDHRAVICCLATGRHRELMAESAPSMVAYARRHDWSVVLTSEPLNGERPPSWGKLQLIRELMSTYEYVFWVDADAIIVDLDRDLLAEIDTAVSDIWFARHPQDRDPGATVLNAGVFAVHSTDWSRRLLTEVWNAEQFIDHNWWENAALLDLLGYSLDPPFAKVRESHWESRVGVLDLAWNSVPGYCESPKPAVNHHARSDHDNFQRRLDDMAADRRATQARFPAEFPAEFPAALGNPHPAPETHTRVERGADAATAPSAVSRLAARGFRFLFLLDAAALFGIVALVGIVRFGEPWADRSVANFTSRFAAATALQIVVCYFAGLYEREPRLGTRSWLPKAVLSMAIGVGAQAALIALDVYLMPRGNLLPWAVAGALALVVNRVVSRRLAVRRHGPARVALVGADDAIELARTHLAAAHDTAVVACELPSIASLSEAVARHQVSDVLLLDVQAFNDVFPHPLTELEAQGVSFLQRVGAQETLLGLDEVREVAGLPCVRLRSHSLPNHQHLLKRGFDLLLLLLVAPVAVVALLLLALWVRLLAGSPVLYRQVRTGKDGVPFPLVKFRTMRRDAEQYGAELSTAGDPRVVRGLGWMRSTRCDELPQLWNVLRGEMSIVGPRPERPEFTAEFARQIPGYTRRSELPPGITGLAQVQGRYDTDAAYKVGYDLQYVSNWSPVLDIQILLRTVWVIVMRRV